MEAGRGSYLCGLVLGIAVGVAGTHVALSGRPAFAPPNLNLASPNDSALPRIDLGPLDSYVPAIRDEFAPTPTTVHAIATAPAESQMPEIVPAEAPRQLPELPHAEPLPVAPVREDSELRAFIRDELQTLAASEHDIWYETLRGLSREDAMEILRIWKMTRAADGSIGLPDFTRLAALPMENPAPPQRPAEAAPPEPSPEAGQKILEHEFTSAIRRAGLHNMANAATPGFKRWDVMVFEQPVFAGTDVRVETFGSSAIWLNTSQGRNSPTGRPFDCAIQGTGFFQVRRGSEKYLTRCGRFVLDEGRCLALPQPDGAPCPLEPEIVVPRDCERLTIAVTGEVLARVPGQAQAKSLGRIELVHVFDPSALKPIGGNLLGTNEASGPANPLAQTERGVLLQGSIEESNVDIAEERRRINAQQPLESPLHAAQPLRQAAAAQD